MVIINGDVNGCIVRGNICHGSTCKKVDKTKKESANGVNRIAIYSRINVKVSACNTTDVIAHLHGSGIMDGDLELSVTRFGDEIQISVKSDETSGNSMPIISGNSIVINNFSSGSNNDLTLDITIPNEEFEKISVEIKNANIDVASYIKARFITVENKNGNVALSATFQTLSIKCNNGNVNVDSKAHGDIRLNVNAKNGNVDVSIGNIATSHVSVDSKNGSCKNNTRLKGTLL